MCDHSRLLTRLLTLVSLHSRSIGFGQPHNKHRVCSGLLKYVSRNFDRKYKKIHDNKRYFWSFLRVMGSTR